MSYGYSYNDILVTPDQLWDFAWSAPMRDLAAKLDLSDVGLKKLLRSNGISSPPQGHWNRVHAGKPVTSRPKTRARRPGETGRIWVSQRFLSVLTPAEPMPAEGPFASELVPEDLEELRAQELKAIGRAAVPRTLDAPHRGLHKLLAREERRRKKFEVAPWSFNEPEFDTPLAKRRLKILNAILLALAKRGHDGSVEGRDGEITARAVIGDTSVGLELAPTGRQRTVLRFGYQRLAPDLPATTALSLRVSPSSPGHETWQDEAQAKLENKIAEIAAGIIVTGERRFRLRLREDVERREQVRIAEERARQKHLAELNLQRLQDLRTSGDLLRQAEDIRSLVARVKLAITGGSLDLEAKALQAWETWALAEADRLDPIKSGQIESHLRPPKPS